jgi:hypothetical protein
MDASTLVIVNRECGRCGAIYRCRAGSMADQQGHCDACDENLYPSRWSRNDLKPGDEA